VCGIGAFLVMPAAIVAIVLGLVVRSRVPKGHPDHRLASWGLWLGVASILVVVILAALVFAFVASFA